MNIARIIEALVKTLDERRRIEVKDLRQLSMRDCGDAAMQERLQVSESLG